jgi:hypothetical protein
LLDLDDLKRVWRSHATDCPRACILAASEPQVSAAIKRVPANCLRALGRDAAAMDPQALDHWTSRELRDVHAIVAAYKAGIERQFPGVLDGSLFPLGALGTVPLPVRWSSSSPLALLERREPWMAAAIRVTTIKVLARGRRVARALELSRSELRVIRALHRVELALLLLSVCARWDDVWSESMCRVHDPSWDAHDSSD